MSDVEIDLIADDTLTQVKRVTSRTATFGSHMQDQFEMTVAAAQLSGRSKIRYVVPEEAPAAFVDAIRSMPLPDGMSLSIERIPATRKAR